METKNNEGRDSLVFAEKSRSVYFFSLEALLKDIQITPMQPETPDNTLKKKVTVREWIAEEKKQSPEKLHKNEQKLLSEDSYHL